MSITTDGAPSMVGKHKGVVSLLQKHMQINGIDNSIVKLQCLIHQEALCAKVASLKDVMSIVVKTVNLILSRGCNDFVAMFLSSVTLINFRIKHLIKVLTVTVNECSCAFSFVHEWLCYFDFLPHLNFQ